MSRLYYLHPWLAGPLAGWGALLDRVAAMGFDRVLTAPPWPTGAHDNILASASFDALDPRLDLSGPALDGIAQIAERCRERGLTLALDLVADRAAAGGGFAEEHADWFSPDAEPFDDPRQPPPERGIARLRTDDAAVLAAATEWWAGRVAALAEAGVAGFRCEAPARLPATFWRAVTMAARAARPECAFFAWTPGLPWDALGRLENCGFDWVFASTPWWNFRAPWLAEEQARLGRIAPQIAMPEAPFGARVAAGLDSTTIEAGMRRALWVAAQSGDGILVPMGFEYAATVPLETTRGAPAELLAMRRQGIDLSSEIARANALLAAEGGRYAGGTMRQLTDPAAEVTVLLRRGADEAAGARLVAINPRLDLAATLVPETVLPLAASGFATFRPCSAADAPVLAPGAPVRLAPGEVRAYTAAPAAPILLPLAKGRRSVEAGMNTPRLAIEKVSPIVEGGTFPVKRTVGEVVHVEADVIGDGHDEFAAALLYKAADEPEFRQTRMRLLGNDRWTADFPLERLGRHLFAVEAWCDLFATFRSEIVKKRAAGVPIYLEVEEGRRLVEAWSETERGKKAGLPALLEALNAASDDDRYAIFTAPETEAAMQAADPRPFATRSPEQPVDAERIAARFSSWYEMFPRSASGDPDRHGTFDDVIGRLPYVRDMGFDTLYFPPIHPIGRKNRKGRNNTLTPAPDDPGSPYAIGAAEGGHDAIHPELGTLADFRRLIAAAKAHGLEIALDFAIQCSPDHPWLKEHPDWFDWRPDGTIRYAENPPKKYEDIVNVDFYAPGAMPGLWLALRDVVLFWVDEGVKVFRVDNPHTKPLPFWQWMIGEVRARHPEVIFLSEAFTKPKVMYRLAKIGFSQSYTYFTWRNEKWELREYLEELSTTNAKEFFRPHFFVNTPDINPDFLQNAPRPAFLIRAALATTLSGLWGMYNGFELCEGRPDRTKKEYADSEKYEIRAWDWDRPGNIRAEISRLNAVRKANPALQSHLGVEFLNAFNDRILYFEKATPARDNVVLVAVNLDPHGVQEAGIEIPLWKFGLPDHGSLAVEDLMTGAAWTWTGKNQHIRLDPNETPFLVLRVTPQS